MRESGASGQDRRRERKGCNGLEGTAARGGKKERRGIGEHEASGKVWLMGRERRRRRRKGS